MGVFSPHLCQLLSLSLSLLSSFPSTPPFTLSNPFSLWLCLLSAHSHLCFLHVFSFFFPSSFLALLLLIFFLCMHYLSYVCITLFSSRTPISLSLSLHLKLASMASECSWSDAVVELQVWCQLATFCHDAKDHELLLRCAETALKLEEAAAKSLSNMPCPL